MEAMTDSPHWQTALLTLDWGDNLTKLETWIRGRTFAPHWTEFDRNWLRRSSVNAKLPPISRIITGSEDAWRSGANDYWIKHPNTLGWNDNEGLGHYIRLLTMIVRENTAINAIWPKATSKDIRRYFEKALVIVNCMREEWKHKGTLYEYFHATETQLEGTLSYNRHLQYITADLTARAAAVSRDTKLRNGTVSSGEVLDDKSAPTNEPTTDATVDQPSTDQASIDRLTSVLNPKATTWPQDKASSVAMPSSELSGTDNFLETLNDELNRKHIAAQAEVDQAKSNAENAKNTAVPMQRAVSADGVTTPKRKRPATTDEPASTSRALGSALPGISGAPEVRSQDGLSAPSRSSHGYLK